jgi:hypothetical protein
MSKHAQWQETQGNSIPSVLLHCFHAIKASGMHWRSWEALRFCREHVGSTGRSGEKTFKHPTLIRDKAFPVVMRYFLLQPILGGNAAANALSRISVGCLKVFSPLRPVEPTCSRQKRNASHERQCIPDALIA